MEEKNAIYKKENLKKNNLKLIISGVVCIFISIFFLFLISLIFKDGNLELKKYNDISHSFYMISAIGINLFPLFFLIIGVLLTILGVSYLQLGETNITVQDYFKTRELDSLEIDFNIKEELNILKNKFQDSNVSFLKKTVPIFCCLFIMTFLFFISNIFLKIVTIILLIFLSFYSFKNFKEIKNFNYNLEEIESFYYEKILKPLFSKKFNNIEISNTSKFIGENLILSGTLPFGDICETSLNLSLFDEENNFILSNCKVKKKIDYNNKFYYEDVFIGQIFCIPYRTNISSPVQIVTFDNKISLMKEDSYSFLKLKDTCIRTENELFNKNFEVYALDEINAFFVLTPQTIEWLIDLKTKFDKIGIIINDDCIYIAIETNTSIFDCPKNQKEIEYIDLNKDYQVLMAICYIVEEIKKNINLDK